MERKRLVKGRGNGHDGLVEWFDEVAGELPIEWVPFGVVNEVGGRSRSDD